MRLHWPSLCRSLGTRWAPGMRATTQPVSAYTFNTSYTDRHTYTTHFHCIPQNTVLSSELDVRTPGCLLLGVWYAGSIDFRRFRTPSLPIFGVIYRRKHTSKYARMYVDYWVIKKLIFSVFKVTSFPPYWLQIISILNSAYTVARVEELKSVHFKGSLFTCCSTIAEYMRKLESLVSQGSVATCLRGGG